MKLARFLEEHRLVIHLGTGNHYDDIVVRATLRTEDGQHILSIVDGKPYEDSDGFVNCSNHSLDVRSKSELKAIKDLINEIRGRKLFSHANNWGKRSILISVPPDLNIE